MHIRFWGTRGSIPISLSKEALRRKFQQALEGAAGLDLSDETVIDQYLERLPFATLNTIGGNTTCLEIRSGDRQLILDAGSGLRLLGIDLMQRGFSHGNKKIDLLITHTHWDHIQGFPFFQPAFIPNNDLTIHSPFTDLSERLEQQQHSHFFPVPMSYMSAEIEFRLMKEDTWNHIGGFRVQPIRLSHPGVTYGYRIEDGDSCLVVATDSEYKRVDLDSTKDYVEFFRDADLLIFDAQYSLTQVLDRPDWGHSTAMMGAELAHRAGVKRLALFHHDPTSTDEEIWSIKEQAEGYLAHRYIGSQPCEILVACDGLSLEI